MRLEYVAKTDRYILRVPRAEATFIRDLQTKHGFDFSMPASTVDEAVMFTPNPFVAVTFWEHADASARNELQQIRTQIDASWARESQAHIAVPDGLELWPFQKAGVAYALERRHCLIGDQPGLGKTNQAIAIANEIQAERVLVICPASIRLQWAKRIEEWSTMRWPVLIHPILSAKRGTHPNAEWTIVSYELASHPVIGAELAKMKYDLLVLDEAHYLKEHTTNRTRAIFGRYDDEEMPFEPLAERAEKIVALTGTPLPNRPREAYTLARGLCWDSMDYMSEDTFVDRFNPRLVGTGKNGKRFVDERTGHHAELQNRLRSYFMVRREKRTVMSQLKLPIYDLIYVEETGPVKAALAAEALLDIDPDKLDDSAMFGGQVAIVRRQMGIAMAPQVANWVDMLIDGGEEKLVVFAWHIEVLNILQEKLKRHGIIRVDGSTGAKRKEYLVEQFVKNPNIKVAIGNILSMGVGTDGLQLVCSHALIAEPDWVPGNNIQCFDRLDRGGQTHQVQGEIFVAPGSIAEKILAIALRKGHVIHDSLDNREFAT